MTGCPESPGRLGGWATRLVGPAALGGLSGPFNPENVNSPTLVIKIKRRAEHKIEKSFVSYLMFPRAVR